MSHSRKWSRAVTALAEVLHGYVLSCVTDREQRTVQHSWFYPAKVQTSGT